MSPLAQGSATDKLTVSSAADPNDSVLYLRTECVFRAQVDDEHDDTAMTPHRVVWHSGDHKRAQEVEIEVHGSVLPYPLDHIGSVFVSLFMDAAETPQGLIRDARTLRFCGYLDDEEVDDEARIVTFKARDLSSPLREHKPLIPKKMLDGRTVDPTPRYSDTIRSAIERILSVVPGFDDPEARDMLTLREVPSLDFQLGSLVDGRAKTGPIGLPPRSSAWDAIEVVCGLAARLVNVELNELVVREPREAFANSGQPDYTFIFGSSNANSFAPKRHKKFIRNRKGIKLVAWNPETRKRMEALYPSDDDMRKNFPRRRPPSTLHHKPQTAKTKKAPAKPPNPPDRDVQDIGSGVFSQDQLDAMAERLWVERSMHELDGSISSPIWDEENFALKNGSRIAVKIRPDIEAQMRSLQNDEDRAKFLETALGLDEGPARTLVRIAMTPHDDLYCASKITREWPGKRAITVSYVNLLRV